jgi:ABC-type transport system involved in cytochrome bd biosynthesis fused ATPase/permease subunit
MDKSFFINDIGGWGFAVLLVPLLVLALLVAFNINAKSVISKIERQIKKEHEANNRFGIAGYGTEDWQFDVAVKEYLKRLYPDMYRWEAVNGALQHSKKTFDFAVYVYTNDGTQHTCKVKHIYDEGSGTFALMEDC